MDIIDRTNQMEYEKWYQDQLKEKDERIKELEGALQNILVIPLNAEWMATIQRMRSIAKEALQENTNEVD